MSTFGRVFNINLHHTPTIVLLIVNHKTPDIHTVQLQHIFIHYTSNYRTLRGQDQREKCVLNFIKYTRSKEKVCFKFHKVHFSLSTSTLLTTKSALLYRKECFVERIKHSLQCNKTQLPTFPSAG